MGFFSNLFGGNSLPGSLDRSTREEVERLITELIQIGQKEDFLSERPGSPFDGRCHHMRARAIGKRLNEIGGVELMTAVQKRIQQKSGANLADHLAYCWSEIGKWIP